MILDRDLDGNGAFDPDERFVYHADGLGSISALTDSIGTVAAANVHDSFGQIATQSGTLDNPYTYTGREFDSESGLYYDRARYYDPMVGRFLSEDSMGFRAGDTNLYRYVFNNPVKMTDPFGLEPIEVEVSTNGFIVSIECPMKEGFVFEFAEATPLGDTCAAILGVTCAYTKETKCGQDPDLTTRDFPGKCTRVERGA